MTETPNSRQLDGEEQENAPLSLRFILSVGMESLSGGGDDDPVDDLTDDAGSQTSSGVETYASQGSGALKEAFASRLRKCVIAMFLWIAVFVPVVVYMTTRKSEVNSFELEYYSLSDQVIDAFESNVGSLFVGFDSLSVAATSHALDSNSTWPFVTLNDFDYLGASTKALTETTRISFNPLVSAENRKAWESYVSENVGWVWQAVARKKKISSNSQVTRALQTPPGFSQGYPEQIYKIDTRTDLVVIIEDAPGPYLPSWQVVPIDPILINFNVFSDLVEADAIRRVFEISSALISRVENLTMYDPFIADYRVAGYSVSMAELEGDANATYKGEPISSVYYPVFDTFDEERQVVAILSSSIFWERFFTNLLPPNSLKGVICVVENSCGDLFTYRLDGEDPEFLGHGDLHDQDYDEYEVSYEFGTARESKRFSLNPSAASLDNDFCPYSVRAYPSSNLQYYHSTNEPIIIASATFAFFMLLAFVSLSYDWIVRRRLRRIMKTEKQAHAAVSAHFPSLVRDRMLANKKDETFAISLSHPKARIKSYLDTPKARRGKIEDHSFLNEAPIADSFLHCTVFFADICGFSAWSSEREPDQVFMLLETIFQTFDRLARKRSVFKVETIGDSYVAVTGLPEAQPDHALRMARFARDCVTKANETTRNLEKVLGPGTADLQFRFGLHSGQVTAGVLRGEKTRFQLFGDTVNTASRMESTGQGSRIQLSETTASLLIEAGKEEFVQPRHDLVNVKGKGVIKTYWLSHHNSEDLYQSRSTGLTFSRISDFGTGAENAKDIGFSDEKDLWGEGEKGVFTIPQISKVSTNQRLVDWLLDMFQVHLKRVIAQRQTGMVSRSMADPEASLQKSEMVLDEVVDACMMPKFDPKKLKKQIDPKSVQLSPEVVSQLREYIEAISMQYRDNMFHNFEHASHVTLSAIKLLNRIVVPEDIDYGKGNINKVMSELHDYTFGLTSDALAQFAVAFSTLIHDVDHRGVPNGQLAKEIPEMGDRYQNRSVAEQQSIDLAWNMLMEPQFKDLRQCIFANDSELRRFRRYVVNLVMATDIFESGMKQRRQERWVKAFAADTTTESTESVIPALTKSTDDEAANLKATIVMKHIIQAADVSHTMQHWRVYKRWNELLFREMYAAYETGRAEKDPSEGWYGGEIWFFDNYVIPLARKLEECGVFGVSSDECLTYAMQNRREWEEKGEAIVQEMVVRYHKRKKLEIGGFTSEEINSFSAMELEHILKLLIKKGRAFGTFKGCDKHGQRNAAQAWLDALEIHERCPESVNLKDPTIVFPVFSGLVVFMKGGKILQGRDCDFEQNLARKYVRDTKQLGDPVHYSRALALLCEVQARAGKCGEALETCEAIKAVYDPAKHSEGVCKAYGTDRTAHAFSQSALWYHQLGDTENSVKACDYIVEHILHHMDPSNILNSCELLFPVVRIQAYRGQVRVMRELFNTMVVQNFHYCDTKFTPCRPILKPLIMLLDLWHDPDNYLDFEDTVDWLLVEENGAMDDFVDNIYVKLGWAPNTVTADLCLRAARKYHLEGGDAEKVNALVKKGIVAARKAEWKMKGEGGEVNLVVAYEAHEPVWQQLVEFAVELGLDSKVDVHSAGINGDITTRQSSMGAIRLAA